ncbi:ribosome hibernation-promoting factor, HPF/YfiA family [Neisseria sp. Ec49-e6-T10]|uniref:ribosome hibernation-promoting factor, HPF/YfiA family n=1 Tax=Neisseria sp. Ec49-e6-T10 TaxID=3140744 RepID=UPI003EC01EF6
MSFQLTGVHLEVTETIREYVEKKLNRCTKNLDGIISTSVILSVEKHQQKAEINVDVAGKDFHVEAADSDLYAAIDAVTDKLNRVLIKHKEMTSNHRNTPTGRKEFEDVDADVEVE